jgi:putative SOS response-associated peptidase YedK
MRWRRSDPDGWRQVTFAQVASAQHRLRVICEGCGRDESPFEPLALAATLGLDPETPLRAAERRLVCAACDARRAHIMLASAMVAGSRHDRYIVVTMCGRITQTTGELPGLLTVTGDDRDSRVKDPHDYVRYNGAPRQDFWIVRYHRDSGQYRRDRANWGLIPHWVEDRTGGRRPINARAESVAKLPTFRDGYQRRRCLVPVKSFFEWRAIKGARAKQPYAIGLKSKASFGLAGIWENWRIPETDEWVRTFCIITTDANDLVRAIHDRMPVIIAPESYERWLSNFEPDPNDLLVPFPSELMEMWPVSPRVNKADPDSNSDPSLLDPIEEEPDNTLL